MSISLIINSKGDLKMEVAYYYDMAGNAAMKKLLDEDFFKRLGPVCQGG